MASETNIYGLWAGRKTALGAALAAPSRRLIQVAGGLGVNIAYGGENYSDLSPFGDQTDWLDSVQGAGTPGVECTADDLAWLSWLYHGGETVTAEVGGTYVAGLKKHHTEPITGIGFVSKWWKRVGQQIVQRQIFDDCYLGQLVVEASTGTKALRATPSIISLQAGEVFALDPTGLNLPGAAGVLLYTEAASTFTIDGLVIRGQTQFTFTTNSALTPVFGDDVLPYDVRRDNSAVSLGVTIQADADGLAQYNKLVYGTATPAAGAKPLRRLPGLGSYSFSMKKLDPTTGLITGEFDFAMGGVRWTPFDAVPANPDGGAVELSLAGAMRKSAPGAVAYTMDLWTPSVAFTA